MNKFVKHLIVSKIKGLATQIKQSRRELLTAIAHPKYDGQLPFVKQRLGEEARYQHLAYTFLRGIPYSVAENKCGPNNAVKVKRLFDTIQRNIEFSYDYWLSIASTQENVGKWLAGEVIEVRPRPIAQPKPIEEAKAAYKQSTTDLKQNPITNLEKVLSWLRR